MSHNLVPDDDELVVRLLDRDDTALVDLQKRDGPYLLAALRKYFPTLSEEDREEIYSDVWQKAWRNIHSYDEQKSSLRTWVFRIARNTAIDHRRSAALKYQQRQLTRDEDFWAQQEDCCRIADEDQVAESSAAESDPRVAVVREALNSLSSVQRAILLADANMFPGQADANDLAAWLGRPPGTIRVERHRALKKIQAALARAGLADSGWQEGLR